MTLLKKNLFFLHIPKTAGTSLIHSFNKSVTTTYRLYDKESISKFNNINNPQPAFIAGHLGYTDVLKYDANIVTLLRQPIERVISVYYYWRHLVKNHPDLEVSKTKGPKYASKVGILEFAKSKEPFVIEEIDNRQFWQVVYDHKLPNRLELAKTSQDELIKIAKKNIDHMKVAGTLINIDSFTKRIKTEFNLDLQLDIINKTKQRRTYDEVPAVVKKAIYERCFLDFELYYYVQKKENSLNLF